MNKVMYLRPTRQDQPVGCVVYAINNGTASYQVSVVNSKPYEVPGGEKYIAAGREKVTKARMVHDEFNRADARKLATEKFNESPISFKFMGENDKPTAWQVVACLMSHMSFNKGIPGRAQRTASQWMRAHGFTKKNKNWIFREV